ncbi:pyridoxamine 5'-phosphate oxidase family protein [Mesorhizobium sp. A623]
MTREECIELLEVSRLARLACSRENQPYLIPIQYAYEQGYFYSFSMQGQKIDWMRENPSVCLQVDHLGGHREWRSVIVYGTFEELPDRIGWKRERDHAWSLLEKHANWWEPGALKPVLAPMATPSTHLFYRVKATRITGRQAIEKSLPSQSSAF